MSIGSCVSAQYAFVCDRFQAINHSTVYSKRQQYLTNRIFSITDIDQDIINLIVVFYSKEF